MQRSVDDALRILLLPAAPLLAAALLGGTPLAQETWYVDDDAPPGGNGSSAQPFRTIQAGIQASADGDLVLVLPGTYAESVSFQGKEITVRGRDGAAATVIAPNNLQRGVTFDQGETTSSVLEGLTVRNGQSFVIGGGILVSNGGATIRDCVVRNNRTEGPGGGIACVGSTLRILGTVIRNNTAEPGGGVGGGVYASNSWVDILGSQILDNTAFSDPVGEAAGLYLGGPMTTLEGNVIAGNRAVDYGYNEGGGLEAYGTLVMRNNVVANNVAAEGDFPNSRGGGMLAGGTLFLRQNVFWGNRSPVGPQLACIGKANADYNVFQGGLAAIGGSGVVEYGPNNLASDPLFVDPAARDYHVLPSSPVVDAGGPSALGGTDGDLDPRRLDGDGDGTAVIDIGWDEVNPTVFQVAGTPEPGAGLTLTTSAPASQAFLHLVGLRAIDVPLPPYGGLLVGSPLFRVGSGLVPGATSLPIPPDPSLAGLDLHLQSLARRLETPVGAFSRRVTVRIP